MKQHAEQAEPADRGHLAEVEADVARELAGLRARLPHLEGALAATTDGLVLAHDVPGGEPDSTAAVTAVALGVAVRLAETTGQGALRELLVRGEKGYVASYAAGPSAVLTVMTGPRANVGRLHLEARRCGARIAELVREALERPRES